MARHGFSLTEDCGYVVRKRFGKFYVYHEWREGPYRHRTLLTKGYSTASAARRAADHYRAKAIQCNAPD